MNPHNLNDDYDDTCSKCKKRSVSECERCAEEMAEAEDYKYRCAMETFETLANITRPQTITDSRIQTSLNRIEFAALRIENVTKTLI